MNYELGNQPGTVIARAGSVEIGDGRGLALIAGPCVIESEDLCMEVAERVIEITRELGVPYIFKASFDKANGLRWSRSGGRGWIRAWKCLRRSRRSSACLF